MRAAAFLKLVGEMLTAQQDFFAFRRRGDLIKAKDLEKRAMAVVKEGRLEPDEPTPAIDFVTVQRPNEPEQKPLFTEGDQ